MTEKRTFKKKHKRTAKCLLTFLVLSMVDGTGESSLKIDKAENIKFYSYWGTTGDDSPENWLTAGKHAKNIRIYSPAYNNQSFVKPYDFSIAKDVKLIYEPSLSIGASVMEKDVSFDDDNFNINVDPGVKDSFAEENSSAAYALDGDLTTFWEAEVGKAVLQVDLKKVITIRQFTFMDAGIYTYASTANIKEFTIHYSEDGDKWKKVPVLQHNLDWPNLGENSWKQAWYSFPITPIKARYVKLIVKSTWDVKGIVRLREFSIF